MIVAGKVDIGRKRKSNQDKIFISKRAVGSLPNLYIVADGVGGDSSGEIASDLAITSFCNYIIEHEGVDLTTPELVANLLTRAISHANYVVYNASNIERQYKGMGTTFTVVTLIGEYIYISHVGDSRVYAVNNRQIVQLTTDHSLVQEMYDSGALTEDELFNHPMGNYITRAVGADEKIKVDNFMCELRFVEYVLMCSDGLTNMLDDQEITTIIHASDNRALLNIVDKLIFEANNKGGNDNIAVILGKKCEVM